MKLIGILVGLNALIITAWYITNDNPYKQMAISICIVAIFYGAFLSLQDRAIELSVNSVGTIKAAAEEASLDAQEISKIKQRVENQSATIDLVASKAAEADLKIHQIGQLISFQSTIISAKNDDRNSFNRLEEWSKDKSFPFYVEAGKQWRKLRDDASIIDQLSKIRLLPVDKCAEALNDNHKKPLEELVAKYNQIPYSHSPYMKCAYIIYIADKRTDIPLKERLEFLVSVIQSDSSLDAAKCAGWRFWANTTPSEEWLNKEKIISFWEANKKNY